MESFNSRDLSDAGLPTTFVQDNHSRSTRGVLRGLHYQYPKWQGKLVRAIVGAIFDVAVDIRKGSSTYGHWVGHELTAENGHQMYVPIGFAHGFVTLCTNSEIVYKCSDYYALRQRVHLFGMILK